MTPLVLGPFPSDRRGVFGMLCCFRYYLREMNWWLTRQIMFWEVHFFGGSSYKGGM